MARRRSFTRTGGRSVPARKFVWARHQVNVTVASGQIERQRLLQEFRASYGADLVGATIVRVRGTMATLPASAAAGGGILGGIVRTDLSAVPDPANEGPNAKPHADWFLFEAFHNATIPGQSLDTSITARRLIDVKSSRKIEELDEEAFLYIAVPPSSADTLFVGTLSIGLKLP